MKKQYSKEFKVEAVRLVREESLSVAQAARDLGMNETTLYNWVSKAAGTELSKVVKEPESEELKRLRRENRQLKLERDILKKATAFFAKSSSDDMGGL